MTRGLRQCSGSICLTPSPACLQGFQGRCSSPMTSRERLLLIAPGVLFLVAFGAFELGRLASRKDAERKAAAQKAQLTTDSPQDTSGLIAILQAQNLDRRRFSFARVIEQSSGHRVTPFDSDNPASSIILEAIRGAADQAMKIHSEEGSALRSLRRINEGSRCFEETLRAHIDAHRSLFCSIPETVEGKEQRAGYPDLRIEHVESGTVAYLDPKLYEEKNRYSTLRTFYYNVGSISSSKITEDAHHLLLGFSHDGAEGEWTFLDWELLDLSTLETGLKAEFHASNRDLYSNQSTIARSRPSGAR